MSNWYDKVSEEYFPDVWDGSSYGRDNLALHALRIGKVAYSETVSAYVTPQKIEEFQASLRSIGFALFACMGDKRAFSRHDSTLVVRCPAFDKNEEGENTAADEHGKFMAWAWTNTLDIAVIDALRQFEKANPVPPPPPPKEDLAPLWMLVRRGGEFSVVQLGTLPDSVLVRTNYEPKVVEQFDAIVAEFKKPKPRGRLAIMDGPPGTGKTWLVRAAMNALRDDATCVVVPSHLVSQLEDPSLVLALAKHRNDHNGSIVLIVEDADTVLCNREDMDTKAMAGLSVLLNLGDGLYGAALDIKVIATTNRELSSLDDAVVRVGRLCEHIHIGPLKGQEVISAAARGLGIETNVSFYESIKLAELYALKNGIEK